jgi:hypothetical protein
LLGYAGDTFSPAVEMGVMDENPYRSPKQQEAESAERRLPYQPVLSRDVPAVELAVFLTSLTAAMLFALAYVLWRRHI